MAGCRSGWHASMSTWRPSARRCRLTLSTIPEYAMSGRYYQSIEISEGEKVTDMVADIVGDHVLMYASDYLGASGEVAHVDSRYVEAGKAPPVALIEGGISGGSFFVLRGDLQGKSLDELRGMKLRVGLSNPSSYHLILFRAFLRSKGLTTNDFQWQILTVGGQEMLPAMVSRQLDGFMHDALTTTLALRAKTGFVFMSSDRGDFGPQAKQLPGTGVCGNRAFIAAHPDVTRRFTQALRDASANYASAPKSEMVAIM